MFRDDELAIVSRVDALQRAVDRLQEELTQERAENDRLRTCLQGELPRARRKKLLSTPAGSIVAGALVGLLASAVALLLL
jgi:hypothetical protein